MANLHDLATIIGNSALLTMLGALAAGLAAIAMMAGVSKVRRSALPEDFPGDSEAQLDKYVVPFQQLDQVGKDNSDLFSTLVDQLKNKPAAHLGLTAFERFAAGRPAAAPGQGNKSGGATSKPTKAGQYKPGADLSDDDAAEDDYDDDAPKTVDISRPKPTNKKAK